MDRVSRLRHDADKAYRSASNRSVLGWRFDRPCRVAAKWRQPPVL